MYWVPSIVVTDTGYIPEATGTRTTWTVCYGVCRYSQQQVQPSPLQVASPGVGVSSDHLEEDLEEEQTKRTMKYTLHKHVCAHNSSIIKEYMWSTY